MTTVPKSSGDAATVKRTVYLLSEVGGFTGPNALFLTCLPLGFRNLLGFEKKTGCWIWLGARGGVTRNPKYHYGYYKLPSNGNGPRRGMCAHKFSYQLIRGPVPDGLELDHVCDVKLCVNPWHLEPVTHSENIRRSYQRGGAKPHGCAALGNRGFHWRNKQVSQ